MKAENKLKQQGEQNREENKTLVSLRKACEQSALRKIADYVLWEVLELDELARRVISLIDDFFDD
jgi:hypothetical protein